MQRRSTVSVVVGALFGLLLGAGEPALAGSPSRAGASPAYSEYEESVLSEALAEVGGRTAVDPVGRRIERIDIVRLEVFDHRDPVPLFFNVFHATTRERIVRRELLFREDDVYDPASLEESARNLRALRQFSLVLIVPLEGHDQDSVRVLVITKDVWSLRLNTNFDYDGTLNRLVLNPSEWNLLGTHVSFGGLFILAPMTYSLGAVVEHPRLAGSRLRSSMFGNVIFNRDTGATEGSFGSFSYGQPLYSRTSRWGFGVALAWRNDIERELVGSELQYYDAPSTTLREAIPVMYQREVFGGEYRVVRSFGLFKKVDISLGLEAISQRYRPHESNAGGPDPSPEAVSDFVSAILPVSDTRIGPFFQIETATTEYRSSLNYDTLGLQEDFRLGHHALLRVYPAGTEFGSTRDLLGVVSAAGYTWPISDGLLRVIASSTIEASRHGQHEAALTLSLHGVSPDVGFGRFIYDGILLNRYKNALNRRVGLGGDSRLRGFPTERFRGNDAVASNLEFRSSAIDILSAQVGGAAFYDVGHAFDGFDRMDLKQSAGLGVRILFAQANRSVFRADWGMPLGPNGPEWPGAIFATFGQAFRTPSIASPDVTDLVP